MKQFQWQRFSIGRQQGFTLLEALIALVILAGGLLAMFRFHGTSVAVTGETKNRAAATALAQAKLEELRAFQTAPGYSTRVVNGAEAGLANTDYDGVAYAATFSRSWVVTPTANPDINQVDVTVTWPRRDNVDGSVMLSAMVVKADPQGGAGEIAYAIETANTPPSWNTGGGGSDGDDGSGGDSGGDDGSGGDSGGDDGSGDPQGENYPYDITISGTIVVGGNGNLSFTGASGSGNYGAACTVATWSYSCTISGIDSSDAWTGSIVFSSSSGACSPSLSFSSITSNQVENVALLKVGSTCVLAN